MLSIPTLPGSSLNRRRDFDRNPQVADNSESLEVRTLLAKQTILMVMGSNGELNITGTKKADVIDITKNGEFANGGQDLKVNGQIFEGVKRINITTGNGPDSIRIAAGVKVPANIQTGKGNDSVYALGSESDVINVAEGKDVVVLGEAGVLGKPDTVELGRGRFNDNAFLNWNDLVTGVERNDSVQYLDKDPGPVDPVDPVVVEEILYVDGNFAPDPFEVLFQGDTLSLQRSSIATEDGGVFYRAILNGVDRGDFRANGKIIIQVPGGENGGNVTIDPALKIFLKSQEPHPEQGSGGEGWLQFKDIDSTALPALPQSFFSTLDILMSQGSLIN